MSKKILIVQGSPRKNGNTRAISAVVAEEATKFGAEVVELDATKLKFKVLGCIDCMKCKTAEGYGCAIKDEVSDKIAKLVDYDVIVFSTPLYWWSYTAQIKIFIDRIYSLCKHNKSGDIDTPLRGKTLALLATAGGGLKDNLEILESQLKNPANMLGCKFSSCLFPNTNHEEGSLLKDEEAVKKAKQFGKDLTEIE